MVTPKKKSHPQRIGLHCPNDGTWIDLKEGVGIRIADNERATSHWFQGPSCQQCGMKGNICMAIRKGQWLPVVVVMTETQTLE